MAQRRRRSGKGGAARKGGIKREIERRLAQLGEGVDAVRKSGKISAREASRDTSSVTKLQGTGMEAGGAQTTCKSFRTRSTPCS